MIAAFCILLPPVFLMYFRDKILGGQIGCAFNKDVLSFIKEYFLTVLFLNFVAIFITYKVFHHVGEFTNAFSQYTAFAFRYLLLVMVLSIAEPFIENLLRFNLSFELAIKYCNEWTWGFYFYTIILFFLNFVRIFDNAFWGDEGYSISLAQMSIFEMINATAKDVHPPLYYLLIQILYRIGGNHGAIYHLSALLPYAGLLIIACTIVKRHIGFTSAFILVTMSSIMKNAVIYNVEVRMYSLSAFFVFVAYIYLYEIIHRSKGKDWIIFCLASLGAAYSHYYALIAVAFFYVILLLLSMKRAIKKRVIAAYVITILAYLPWLFILIKTFRRTADSWWLTSIPGVKESILFMFDYKWVYLTFAVVVLLFFLCQSKIVDFQEMKDCHIINKFKINVSLPENLVMSNEMVWVIAGLVSVFGTLFVGLALSYMIRPFFIVRYLFPVTPIVYLILGYCLSKIPFGKIVSLLLVVCILFVDLPAYENRLQSDNALNKDNSKFLSSVKPSDEAMIYTNHSHLGWTLLSYYYPQNENSYNQNIISDLGSKYDEIWLFWTSELDDKKIEIIRRQTYDIEKQYEGRFANGVNFHVYRLKKENLGGAL